MMGGRRRHERVLNISTVQNGGWEARVVAWQLGPRQAVLERRLSSALPCGQRKPSRNLDRGSPRITPSGGAKVKVAFEVPIVLGVELPPTRRASTRITHRAALGTGAKRGWPDARAP